ncbi:hypothetical protein [Tenacibaculum finnmarkense]|uniref:hypothetical protein n=1 Tax=Tenacibaculum finnmarkense TaxID=2781243 RepID=UPI001E3D1366|nr:hypothetical protein [Tenacibaculum finnmarkense]MCD8423601.1 hypothetical protein [Tenacibaculum finnmarkense genomovar ulcerans]MCG8239744.1 hypothetical protein [Tenacibaculum finnmarkense genomovar ulcerans]
MNRAIWSDNETNNNTKVECLRLSNELVHRIWNLLFDLKQRIDNNSENLLTENIDFYRKQSIEFSEYLGPTIQRTIETYNLLNRKRHHNNMYN